jgi:Site-specific DNA methylase
MNAPRILHYPGSKWSMAEWIISHMPPHQTYLEPFFGSGAVFFNKPPSPLETINDIDGDVVNLFRVIRDRPDELARLVYWTPYSREEYYNSYQLGGVDELERARRFLVRCWMARSGVTANKTGWRNRIVSDRKDGTQKWFDLPEIIIKTAERLKFAQIEQQPALELIRRYKREDVLIYADPPYPLETRSGRMYKNEMTDADHAELLDVLDAHPGPVLLSGYANELYDTRLRHWNREERRVLAEAGQIRTEVLWINPVAAEHQAQLTLF